jgi:spore coat protein U-like protein
VDVALDLGLGPAPTLAARQMRGTNDINNVLPYYLETPTNTDWGSTVGTDTVNLTAQGINIQDTVTIQGTITLADIQVANADQYNDTVVITLVL